MTTETGQSIDATEITAMPKPNTGWFTASRVVHGLLALTAFVGIAASFYSMQFEPAAAGDKTIRGFAGAFNTLSYFTMWSNITNFIVLILVALNPARNTTFFRWIRLTALVMMTVTGIIYALVLAPLYAGKTFPPMSTLSNDIVHYFMPWATIAAWLVFGPRPRIFAKTFFSVLILPIIWLAFALTRGAVYKHGFRNGDSYPYPFLDVDKLGYAQVTVNILGIAVFGLALAAIYWGLDRLLSRKAIKSSEPLEVTDGSADPTGGA